MTCEHWSHVPARYDGAVTCRHLHTDEQSLNSIPVLNRELAHAAGFAAARRFLYFLVYDKFTFVNT